MAEIIQMSVLGLVLIIAAITDLRTGKVFNWLTYPSILLGILLSVVLSMTVEGGVGTAAGFEATMVGFGVAFLPFVLIKAMGGMGGGDVKLMGAVGAIGADWRLSISAMFYALIVGAVLALIVMVFRRRTKATVSNLVSAAAMASAKVKPHLNDEDSPRIPFALAICIGGIVAGMEVLLGVNTPWKGFEVL